MPKRIPISVLSFPNGTWAVRVGRRARRIDGDAARAIRLMLLRQFRSGDTIEFSGAEYGTVPDALEAIARFLGLET